MNGWHTTTDPFGGPLSCCPGPPLHRSPRLSLRIAPDPLPMMDALPLHHHSVIGSLSFTTRRGEHVKIPNTYFHIQRERREPLLQLMQQHGCRSVAPPPTTPLPSSTRSFHSLIWADHL